MTKQGRQFAIREIVSTLGIRSQEQLRRLLGRRGIRVTQATLSRDLRDLRVGKVPSGDGLRYVLPPEAEVQALRPLVRAEVVSIAANENIIVLRTFPGCASTVGQFLDVQPHPDIIATIAGDNTVLVVPSSTKKTDGVLSHLRRVLIGES